MKKKIYSSIFLTGFATTILASVLMVYAFYGFFSNQAKAEVKTACEIVKDSIDVFGNNDSYLPAIKNAAKFMRFTLIDKNGKVVFDSQINASNMPNHKEREEFVEARAKGVGEDLRKSETIGKQTYYYAFQLFDGNILRGARDINNIMSVFVNLIPIIGGITALLIIISFWVSNYLTKKLIKPVSEVTKYIANHEQIETPIETYDELAPLFNKMKAQQLKINEQMQTLRQERDTIQTITENMQEGLIVIDTNFKILSVNKSAIQLVSGRNEFSYQGKNMISLISDKALTEKIKSVVQNGNSQKDIISNQNRKCRVYMSAVRVKEQITGAIIIIVDITDIYRAEEIRKEFSANVSHELKTPLTSISGFAEIMESDIVKPEDMKYFAGKIQKEVDRLIQLVEDIIRLTEIEENPQTEMKEVSLKSICEEVKSSLTYAAEKRQVTLQILAQECTILASPYMINELIYNLVDNAIKYNKNGGNVTIEVVEKPDKINLSVSDTGIGIAKEHIPRLFERFYRVDKSRSKQSGGTGLGLSIVKHIANFHQATIAVESVVSKGTTITISFLKQ
ncbi:ATP-binding protein [Paludicola sp. MB14-C6]|uniref:ATP-binding protein n=1 Tax=Paludihabitans sp. MB14-C6 TaxID=3070656 RepID=UPI0027DCE578|nr:ATP-binding protein [Paludicola sp. MB14-C6]WMJ24417.1 ATP-binding protein [Paludicola sp. MB14-C6]